MSRKKKSVDSDALFGEPDIIILPRDKSAGADKREIVSSIVRSSWAKAQEWTVAWKGGSSNLKSVVESLVNLKEEEEIAPLVHEAALQLNASVAKMKACVDTLDELLENLQKVEKLQNEEMRKEPLFSTLTMHHMVCVLKSVCNDYRKETEVKSGVCAILPTSRNVDTLNTAVTLWTHHIHVVTHQFPLKSLLRETQQL